MHCKNFAVFKRVWNWTLSVSERPIWTIIIDASVAVNMTYVMPAIHQTLEIKLNRAELYRTDYQVGEAY